MRKVRLLRISTYILAAIVCATIFMVQNAFAGIDLHEMQASSTSEMETTPTLGRDNYSPIVVYTSYQVINGQAEPADIFAQRLGATAPMGAPIFGL